MSIAPGTRLGPYQITAPLGAGGMGQVYRARDTRLEREVAVKLLTDADGDAEVRLLQEARNASALNHPNICTVHEIGEAAGHRFIVMELVDGEPLDQKIAARPMAPEAALRLGAQIATGLAHAHARGVIHRDLKSANIVLTGDGRAKILDFGIARRIPPPQSTDATRSVQTLTTTHEVAGTLPYMSPEQLEGRPADARSDLWALGVILTEAATGRRPFTGDTSVALTTGILRDDPQIPASLPPSLAAVIRKLLAKAPGDRYQSAAEVAGALNALAEQPFYAAQQPAPARRSVSVLALSIGVVLAIAAIAAWAAFSGRNESATGPRIRSIAVLPLDNLSGDDSQQYFADGMTEALIAQLAAVDELRVISRTSVMQFRDSDEPLGTIARALNVDGIVEGAILHDGASVRITARLIDARSDQQVWSGEYEKPLSSAIALQREVAASIGREIRGELSAGDTERLSRPGDVNADAYQSYLRGRFHWNHRTYSELQQAARFFEDAIAKDPGFAPAHAGLADVYVLLGDFRDMLPAEAYRRARAAADAALRLDPSLAEAHTTRAWLAFATERDWQAAEAAFGRALELNAGYATAHQWKGEFLIALGRFDEAFESFRRAEALDPLALMPRAIHGWAAYLAGRFTEAIALCEQVLSQDPTFRPARMYRAWTYMDQNRLDEAEREVELLLRTSSSTAVPLATVGRIHARRGERRRAADVIDQLEALAYPPSFDIAKVYAELKNRDETLAWLAKAESELNSAVLYVEVDRAFDWLSGDAQFEALLTRLKLR